MSAAEAWPTEDAATKAVDGAARAAYDADIKARRDVYPPSAQFPTFDELEPTTALAIREAVLPMVWAALEALPDPRYAAWEEGFEAGGDDAMYEERGTGPNPNYPHKNPYPSGL